MTRRRLFALVALLSLSGFTLSSFVLQTERTRWENRYVGAAYNTAVPEDTNLSHCFYPSGYTGLFGGAYFRTGGIQCTWGVAGSGGAGVGVWAKIVHEDAGIDCRCHLGDCTAAAATEISCTCEDGGYSTVQLGKTIMPDAGEQGTIRHCLQLDPLTDCAANPAQLQCSIDLFR